jgi:hypothetical protein
MTFNELFTLLGFIAFIVLISGLPAMVTIRKLKSDRAKRLAKRWFAVEISTFLVGAIARGIQEDTGILWLNGFVSIFIGLFVSLLGALFFWRTSWLINPMCKFC